MNISGILDFKTKINQSVKYRFWYSYYHLIRQIKCIQRPNIKWKPLDSSLPRFISIVHEADVPLLAYSLNSLMRQVDKRPNFWLVGDSDAAYAKLQSWLSASSPSDVEFWHWETLLPKLDPRYQSFIKTWLHSGQWGGYAKKFAITLAANADADILLFDADVLWFGDFPSILQSLRQKNPTILAGQDYQQSYDLEVIKFLGDRKILAGAPLNCGLVYYSQGILLETIPAEKLINLLPYAIEATTHLEQTIIAHAFWQANGQWFDSKTLATTMIDNFKLRRQTESLARHYAGGKHLFWRDAY